MAWVDKLESVPDLRGEDLSKGAICVAVASLVGEISAGGRFLPQQLSQTLRGDGFRMVQYVWQ